MRAVSPGLHGRIGGVLYDGEDADHNGELDAGEDENLNEVLDFHDILKETLRAKLAPAISARFLDVLDLHAFRGEIIWMGRFCLTTIRIAGQRQLGLPIVSFLGGFRLRS